MRPHAIQLLARVARLRPPQPAPLALPMRMDLLRAELMKHPGAELVEQSDEEARKAKNARKRERRARRGR